MANCAGLFQSQDLDCLNPVPVGTVQRLLIANLDDIADVTHSIVLGEENVIESITMKSTKSFYEFQNVGESLKVQNELIRGANGLPSYKHQVSTFVFEVDNTALLNMQAMAYSKLVCIAYGVDDLGYGNGAFQFMGGSVGMDLTVNQRLNDDIDSGGVHNLTINTPDSGANEKEIPNVIWSIDYQTTLTLIDGLLTPPI